MVCIFSVMSSSLLFHPQFAEVSLFFLLLWSEICDLPANSHSTTHYFLLVIMFYIVNIICGFGREA